MPQKCHAFNCSSPVVSNGLCDKHRKRLARHGTIEQTRPNDWGKREKHPYYRSWCGLIRYHKTELPDEWLDFWTFVKTVPERNAKSQAHRIDPSKPWAKDNFYWKEPRVDASILRDRAEYMRRWHKAARKADPEYGKNAYMKRVYGVGIDWFNGQYERQGGLCMICDHPETAVIHGKPISLAVDHCHDTGKVRGLLCRACNNAIGALKHDVGLLNRAIDYLKKQAEGTS